MMRLQIESFSEKLLKIVDEEFELDTTEGQDVFKALSVQMYKLFAAQKLKQGEMKLGEA